MSERKKRVEDESSKTRKTREKLKKQLSEMEHRVTRQALDKKTIEIHRWIARHASERVVLRAKTIALFDENQNAAKLSFRISLLAEQLQKEGSFPEKIEESLEELLPRGEEILPAVRGGSSFRKWTDSSLGPALKDRDYVELPVQDMENPPK